MTNIKPTLEEISVFSNAIEELVYTFDISYLDAIIAYCNKNNLEIELASKLISSNLKYEIQVESEKNNLIKKTARLL